MLKTRIVTAIALAAGISLGATGCGFIVPPATTYQYAPGDGVDIDLPNADIRNFFVVAGADSANIVFTGVNNSAETTRVSVKFVEDGTQLAQRNFTLEPGVNVFGVDPQEIIAGSFAKGSMVTAFFEGDGEEIERVVPVHDDSLEYYEDLVPGN